MPPLTLTDPLGHQVAELSVGPQQEVDVVSTASGSSLRVAVVSLAKGTMLALRGPLSSLVFGGGINAADGSTLSISGSIDSLDLQGAVSLAADASLTVGGAVGSLAFSEPPSIAAGASLAISGEVGNLAFSEPPAIAAGGGLMISMEVGVPLGVVLALLNLAEGSVSFEGDGVSVLDTGGAACGGVAGEMSGAVALRLAGAAPVEVPALALRAGLELRVICTAVGSLALNAISLAAGASLIISGEVSSLVFGGGVDMADGSSLSISGSIDTLILHDHFWSLSPDESWRREDMDPHLASNAISLAAGASLTISEEVGSLVFGGGVDAAGGSTLSISGSVGSLDLQGAVSLAADASLTVGGAVGSLAFSEPPSIAAGASLAISGEDALTTGGLANVLSFNGEGALTFEGTAVSVLSLDGAAAGSVAGRLPGTVTLDLAAPLAPGGSTGAHSTDRAGLPEFCGTVRLFTAVWDSGDETSTRQPGETHVDQTAAAFTLYRLPPRAAAFSRDKLVGTAEYAAVCQAAGLFAVLPGVVCDGQGNYDCDMIRIGGICMPKEWSCKQKSEFGQALHARTGWDRVAFPGKEWNGMVGLDADGGAVDDPGAGFSPVCALGH
jgi:hypothetical protein